MSGEESKVRDVTDVRKTLDQAKIVPDTLSPCTQVLRFSNVEHTYKCLELNKELLHALEKGERLVIRGNKSDSAVICTDNVTFDLKESETSNCLLILKDLMINPSQDEQAQGVSKVEVKEVRQMMHTYLEPRPYKPLFKSLQTLLEKHPYKGPEYKEDDCMEGLTTEHLLDTVQASRAELMQELVHIMAVEVDGCWRLLEFQYHFRVLSSLLNYFEEVSMPLNELRLQECCTTLEDLVPKNILKQVFQIYTHITANEKDGEPLYKINGDRVCRTIAETLLRPASKFPLSEFLSIWQESVPEGLKTDLSQLAGIAIVEKTVTPARIWYFPERNLPEEVFERLHKLFQERQAWPLDDILPYMQRLATAQMSVNAILTKYARMSTKGGVKYFTGRHAK